MRRPHKIKAWLADRQITQIDVARNLNVHRQVVCDTIHGRKNHRRVLTHLYRAGCPVAYLGLPDDLAAMIAPKQSIEPRREAA